MLVFKGVGDVLLALSGLSSAFPLVKLNSRKEVTAAAPTLAYPPHLTVGKQDIVWQDTVERHSGQPSSSIGGENFKEKNLRTENLILVVRARLPTSRSILVFISQQDVLSGHLL